MSRTDREGGSRRHDQTTCTDLACDACYVKTLTLEVLSWRSYAEGMAEGRRNAEDRAKAAEAKVARVEALLTSIETLRHEPRVRGPRRVSIALLREMLDLKAGDDAEMGSA